MQEAIQSFVIDDVPCFWIEAEGPLTAGVVFEVGQADEGFPERGLTHLTEHLALHGADREIPVNGFVELTKTMFECRGSVEEIGRFFHDLLGALAELPYRELERECRVLNAEAARQPDSLANQALGIYFGHAGPGRSALPEAGLWEATPDKVEAWRERFFVRKNAAAFFHGPPPRGISFAALPVGERHQRQPATRLPAGGPMFYRTGFGGAAMFGAYRRGVGTMVPISVAVDRLTDRLRGDLGLSYDISMDVTDLDRDRYWLAIAADASAEHTQQVFETMRFELQQLAETGPTEAERDTFVRRLDRINAGDFGDRDAVELDAVVTRARFEVEGRYFEGNEQARAMVQTMSPHELAAPLADALADPLWVIPFDTPVADRRLEEVPTWSSRMAEGKAYPSDLESCALRIDDKRLSLCFDDRSFLTMEHGHIAGVSRFDDGLVFYGQDGFVLPVVPSDFGAEEAVSRFLAGVADQLVVAPGQRLRSEEEQAAIEETRSSKLGRRLRVRLGRNKNRK